MVKLDINGKSREVDVDPETPLLWVLREWVGLTGTKYGCGVAQCGACTVLIDGVATRSCALPAGSVGAAKITTIEGLSPDGLSHPVQVAWLQHEVPQCGYCQSGQILATVSLLKEKPKPTDDEIAEAMTNICRCGTYQRIKAAIHTAAALSVPPSGKAGGGYHEPDTCTKPPLLLHRHGRDRRRTGPGLVPAGRRFHRRRTRRERRRGRYLGGDPAGRHHHRAHRAF